MLSDVSDGDTGTKDADHEPDFHWKENMDLRKSFARLNSSVSPSTLYAVIHGWDDMPNSVPDNCLILCSNREVFAREFGLDVRGGRRSKIGIAQGIGCNFYLIQKGEGLFAETFESQVLARRVITNGYVYIPSPDHHAIALMALAVRRNIEILNQAGPQRVVKAYLSQQVGVGRRVSLYDFT